ncbi:MULTISPECIES: DOMON-like domain-containing protein [unclassified Chamaesiphon]|uniref:DOMON-like domain-containing protein n=1 Tax=unclassified Chamaesiphon TaxID=2620921 RepID=UPI00286AB77E|nr:MULTISPECIES: DOMON-like domain-containing protein [unclassified Chamaesiphon]
MTDFKLRPFSTDITLPAIELTGQIDFQDRLLSIVYHLQGNLETLIIPSAHPTPSRKFALWESTCFEFFIGVPGNANYWEFNLSPAGDWNVFTLDDYRQGLQNELAFTALPLSIDRSATSLVLKSIVDLSKIFPAAPELELSVTAVIESSQHELSYWALTHPGTVADFHRRDSFVLKI